MAYPTDFDSMVAYVGFLMQDSSLFEQSISGDRRGEQINAVAKFLWSERAPQIDFVTYDDALFTFAENAKVANEATQDSVDDVLAVYLTAADTDEIGTPLERLELHEIMQKYADDSSTSNTTTHWAVSRSTSGLTGATAQPFQLWIYPPAGDGVSLACAIRRRLPVLDATVTVDFTREEVAFICRTAAWVCAHLAGRAPEWCDRIVAALPAGQEMMARKYKSLLKPTARMAEEPV